MTRIRVDTSVFRNEGENLKNISSDINSQGEAVFRSANSAPSYNGQFGPKVKAIGNNALSQARQLSGILSNFSGRLHYKAQAFESADMASSAGLRNTSNALFAWQEAPLFLQPFQKMKATLTFLADTIRKYGGLFLSGGLSVLLTSFATNKNAFVSITGTFAGITLPWKPKPLPPLTPVVKRPPGSGFGELIKHAEEEAKAREREKLLRQYDGKNYAAGTYNPKDSYSARLVTPPLENNPGSRRPEIYNAVLNQFGVETNPRYTPRVMNEKSNTYCNIFVWDATRAMGAEIPHWVNPSTGEMVEVGKGKELSANGVTDCLSNYGSQNGWRAVKAEEAQSLANQGSPAVAVWANSGGIGHVAMIRPGEYSSTEGPAIAQAGTENHNSSRVANNFITGWKKNQVIYYVHD